MPKIIDVEQTRLRIARAACKAIARKGISAVTMIDIANAGGVTTGMITHYFESKVEIIAAAMRIPFLNMERKIALLLEKGETDLATLLDVAIPTSKKSFEDILIWVNFWGMVAADSDFRKLNAKLHREGRVIFTDALRSGWPESKDWPTDIFESALRSVVTFIFGLSAGGVTNRAIWTPNVQRSQLQLHLRLIRDWAQQEALLASADEHNSSTANNQAHAMHLASGPETRRRTV
ncbi:AcrR family transcriptional regulator [Sinorhizobium kostiense]|uniref:AcrR family transcriptional regulator n=1 Tax=Sinorhizobium kostiense TaxID=76747 RepID=A0ABS4RAN0_9HYPH|nr:TetR family transcriptional regulator [Sinorhizobium kostiense]MBP2239384.1 AcrR family transcriptional regulator [Sinorhizobium kostiense]